MSLVAEFILQLLVGIVSVWVNVFWMPFPNATLVLFSQLEELIMAVTVSCKTVCPEICLRKALVCNIEVYSHSWQIFQISCCFKHA